MGDMGVLVFQMVSSTLYRPMCNGEERLKIMWIGRLWQDFAKVGAKLVEKLVGQNLIWWQIVIC